MNTQTATPTVDLEKFLIRASAIIKVQGYVSNADAKAADKKSTGALALAWADDNKLKEIQSVTFDWSDKAIGKAVAEWMAGLYGNPAYLATDYMGKLAEIGHRGLVEERTMGYAASAIGAFEREKNKSADEKNSLQEFSAVYGPVGAKIKDITVLFVGRSQFDSRYGLCYKYQFQDGAGRKLTWLTSSELNNLNQGYAYTLEGTVKEYSNYRGVYECQVTRAKLVG